MVKSKACSEYGVVAWLPYVAAWFKAAVRVGLLYVPLFLICFSRWLSVAVASLFLFMLPLGAHRNLSGNTGESSFENRLKATQIDTFNSENIRL